MPAPKDPEARARWIANMSKARKGKPTWNKGRAYSQEPEYDGYRRKQSEAHKSRPHPKGHKLSAEHKTKIGEALKGRRIGFANGGKHSEATKAQMSATHTGVKCSPEHTAATQRGIIKAIMEGRYNPEQACHKTGSYFSTKMQASFHYRSSYELLAYQRLDADPFVALWFPEPCAVPYASADGSQHKYIPDIYIEYTSGFWQIIEIKPEARLGEPAIVIKHQAAAERFGVHFSVWCEEALSAIMPDLPA